MSTKKGVTINFTLTNRWLYTLITFLVLAIVGVGVYAFTTDGSGVPSVMGHSADELIIIEGDPNVKAFAKTSGTLGICSAGSSIRSINRDTGAVICQTDNVGDPSSTNERQTLRIVGHTIFLEGVGATTSVTVPDIDTIHHDHFDPPGGS